MKPYVAPLTWPGGWIDPNIYPNSQKTENHFRLAEFALADAAIALTYFVDAQARHAEDYQRTRDHNPLRTVIEIHHAKGFVFALTALRLLLLDVARMHPSNVALSETERRFDESFGDLVGLRNTFAHINERAQWLAQSKKRLETNAVGVGDIKAEPGAFVGLGSLHGNVLRATTADGTYGEVAICEEGLRAAQQLAQVAIESLQWIPGYRPSMFDRW